MNNARAKAKNSNESQRLVWILMFAFLAMHGNLQALDADTETPPLISSIEVQGTMRIEEDLVLLRIQSQKGSPLNLRMVREDIRSIMDSGYFQNVVVESEPEPGGVRLILVVEERPTIREIRYEGNKKLDEKDFEKVMTLKQNHFLDYAELKENVEKIRKLYANEGYFRADVQYEIEEQENNQVIAVFRIQEKEEIKIRKIIFMGNEAFEDYKLKKVIETKKKGLFSFITSSGVYKEDLLRDDVTRLTLLYLDHGYLQFSADPPMTLMTEDGMFVIFNLHEGNPYVVKSVTWETVSDEDRGYFERIQELRPGDTFSREELQHDMAAMTDHLTDSGYAFAEITPMYFPDEKTLTVDVVYKEDRGPKVHLGEIIIRGNSKTRDKVIRREMEVTEGELYSSSGLRSSRAEINRLGFFDGVNLSTKPSDSPDKLDVIVDVKEGQTGTLSGGAGFSSTDQFMFMANITQSNLFGRAQVLSLNAEVGGTRQNFSLSFTEPWLFDIPLSGGFDVFMTERIYQDFARDAVGGAARIGYEIFRNVRSNIRYKYEDVEISDVSYFAPITLKREEGKSRTSSVTFYVVHDTLDNPMYPLAGFMNVASCEIAGTIFGGNNDFYKLQLDTGYYLPLFWKTSLHLRGRIGIGNGIDGDRLPVFERFFVGGISTMRGFDVRSLGPEVGGVLIGGNKELIFNTEFIFPLVPQVKLRGLVFFDAGNAFSEDEAISLMNLRLSAGGGFRWFSPMGPLTFILGFPLDRQRGEDASAVQFSIGTPF